MMDSFEKKKALRTKMKEQIQTITPADRMIFSNRLWSKMEKLPEFISSENILLFWSLPDEVHTHDFIKKWAGRKNIFLPVIDEDRLRLKQYKDASHLAQGAYNIQEPTGDFFDEQDKIELILVPGLGFDRHGNRIGRGKGYYDKLLPTLPGRKAGICFSFQLTDKIPCDEWDVKMDTIITD